MLSQRFDRNIEWHLRFSYPRMRMVILMVFLNRNWNIIIVNNIESQYFLSLDTESINFYHHLRCGGWLNFEFS